MILDVDLTRLRRRTSMKWQRYPEDVLPLWVAEMDTLLPPGVQAELTRIITEGDTGYPAGDAYAAAYADLAAEEWGWSFDPATAVLSPDVMQGVAMLLEQVLASTGREHQQVVINSPVYPPFWAAVGNSAGELLDVPMTEEGRLDLPALRAAYARPEVTVHLLSSPHNPTGVIHTAAELTELTAAAREHGVVLLLDEIHSPLVGAEFVPGLAVDPDADAVCLTSASKAFNLAGLKGALLVPGTAARSRLAALTYEQTRGAASHVALRAHTAALTEDRDWLRQLRGELAANRELLADVLAEQLPQVGYRPGPGTYLAWLDCRELGWANPSQTFLERGRVAFNDGATFGPSSSGWVRMNLATSPAIITEAVARMVRAVGA